MGKVVTFTSVTLDGVMQAPGRPDEDPRGGFEHGGWAAPYADPVMWEGMGSGGALLLGRRTYEDFYGYWPNQTDNPFTAVLNEAQKYVASTTLKPPLPWSNSASLEGDVPEAVARLKEQSDQDLVVLGSDASGLQERAVVVTHPPRPEREVEDHVGPPRQRAPAAVPADQPQSHRGRSGAAAPSRSRAATSPRRRRAGPCPGR